MLSDQSKRLQARKRFAEHAAMARTKKRDYASRAAAAYDTQEEDLITKTRKIVAARPLSEHRRQHPGLDCG
jgi:hypothetical protein